jgi:hypothetical protein
MMEKDNRSVMEVCSTETGSDSRRVYSAPTLTCFGTVTALTQNGGASGSDGTGNSMTVRGSDTELKTNVARIGTHPAGFGLYLFDYKPEFQHFGAGRQFGVMAQEVECIVPQAVSLGVDGYRRVDYAALGISHTKH